MSSRRFANYPDRVRFATHLILSLTALLAGVGPAVRNTADAGTTAFVGVNVAPMDSERVLRGQTVIIEQGMIVAVGPVDEVEVPPTARVIYGRGRWLMPGLIDMHVHVRAEDLPRYLENGITTVRDLATIDSILQLAGSIDRGETLGPRIIPSSLLFSAPNAQNPPFSLSVTAQSNAQELVDHQIARGAKSIKVWVDLAPAAYDAVVAAARVRGLKVVGHVPQSVDIHHALAVLRAQARSWPALDSDPVALIEVVVA
jgi:imidazolonepropionase-like amidohydrolase